MPKMMGNKGFFRSLVDFPAWMSLGMLRDSGRGIVNLAKMLFIPRQPGRSETFGQAVYRFKLTPEALTKRQRLFGRMALLYCVLAFGLLLYTGYLIWMLAYAPAFMAFVLCMVAGAFAFREHFWYFQMKKKKLGCTLKEWFLFTFRLEK